MRPFDLIPFDGNLSAGWTRVLVNQSEGAG